MKGSAYCVVGPVQHPITGTDTQYTIDLCGAHRHREGRPGFVGPPAQAARQAARRQKLRLRPMPGRLPQTGHHAAHRPQRHRLKRAARPASVGSRAHVGVALPFPPPRPPLRATGGRTPRVSDPGLRARLLGAAATAGLSRIRRARRMACPGLRAAEASRRVAGTGRADCSPPKTRRSCRSPGGRC